MTPEDVGADGSRIVLTSRSGRNAIRSRLQALGVTVENGAIEAVYTRFKAAADRVKTVDDATEACKAAPLPPVDILTTDVYADGGWAWRN